MEMKMASHQKIRDFQTGLVVADTALEAAKVAAEIVDKILEETSRELNKAAQTVKEGLPLSFIVGLSTGGDLTSWARSGIEAATMATESVTDWKRVGSFSAIKALELANAANTRLIEF